MAKAKKEKTLQQKIRAKKLRRRILIVLAVLLLLAAATYTVFIAPYLEQEQWIYKEETVEKGTLQIGVTESGFLTYGITSISYDLNLSITTTDDDDEEETVQKYLKIEEVYVSAGQRISEGDAIFKFTEDSVSDVRTLLESALIDAQADYSDALSEYNLSLLEAQTSLETSSLASQYAAAIYTKQVAALENEISVMEIQITQLEANVTSLEEKIEEAEESLAEAYEAYVTAKDELEMVGTDNGVVYIAFETAYLNALTRYQNAQSSLEQAQSNLESNAEQITSLQTQISQAKAKLTIEKLEAKESYAETLLNGDSAEITYNAEVESLKETLQEAQDAKTEIEEQIAAFEAFVGEDGILYADGAGIVTAVYYAADDKLQMTGTMLSYAKADEMTISVDVTQEDVVDLSVGDTVSIVFDAYEDTTYSGVISSIDTTATSSSSATISYSVVVLVTGDTEALYGGMSADITFVTEEKTDVLYVSRKAIVTENNKTYVYYEAADGTYALKEVETGISNSTYIEIVSGLEEGDVIYLASKVSSEEDVMSSETDEDSSSTSVDVTSMDFSDLCSCTMDIAAAGALSGGGDLGGLSVGCNMGGGMGGGSGMGGGR